MPERLSIGSWFGRDALGPVMKKRLLGGYTVSPLAVIFASVSVFQKGALLAYARADQYERLCTLIAEPGGELSVAEFTRNVARKNWNTYGANSKSLFDYILRSEFPTTDLADMGLVRFLHKNKWRLSEAFNRLQISAANGMGFGVTFPDVFRTMWENSYEHPDPVAWGEAVKAGVDIPLTPDKLPLGDAVELILRETAEYAREYHPHLIAELKLDSNK
jgi:hypothetical protein